MKVYISGAISGQPLADAADRFAAAASRLATAGHVPVNPFMVPPHAGCSCPGAVNAAGAGGGHEWSCYLRGDLAAMLDCDAILMLPGWESSHGARLELMVASAVGLWVLFDVPAGHPRWTAAELTTLAAGGPSTGGT
jgi:hypothetical protein